MKRTFYFQNNPIIISASSVAGPKECAGEVGAFIDVKLDEDTFGESSYEKAEIKMLYTAVKNSLDKANLKEEDINCLIAGDLLNQIISSTFSARSLNMGYLGVYNACSTFTEAIILGATFVDGNKMEKVVCATSSHFSSAERQYRYPLELGSTRPPQSQWTITGAGGLVIASEGIGPKIKVATVGKVVDFGVTDANNMGAAMAPATADTIFTHFVETNRTPDYYDIIVTGDLGALGSRLFKELLREKGYDVEKQHVDCGELIYNICEDEYQGGCGAGCVSVVFCSYLMQMLKEKKINKMLLVATGALLSPLSSQQGESIPGIAHAVALEN